MASSCKGCIWSLDCKNTSCRCEYYENDDEEYGWNEMFYNQDKNIKSIYDKEEMIHWYNELSNLK